MQFLGEKKICFITTGRGILTSPGHSVASESGPICGAVNESPDGEQWPVEANARLIAAAPELLEIANRLQEWDKKWPKYHDRSGESEREMDAICRDAAEIVAKATGE